MSLVRKIALGCIGGLIAFAFTAAPASAATDDNLDEPNRPPAEGSPAVGWEAPTGPVTGSSEVSGLSTASDGQSRAGMELSPAGCYGQTDQAHKSGGVGCIRPWPHALHCSCIGVGG